MKAVIDSDVLIDFLQGVPAAATEINAYDDPLYSVISWMEVMIGADTDEERFAAETLFASMRRVDASRRTLPGSRSSSGRPEAATAT